MDWTFYLIVGGSLALSFYIVYLGKKEKKDDTPPE
ncbi:hypothetical protein X474_21155 [Dethiosulfatarculus sandiegensis]|uniref:Uncharacterized protein n=1 Tax=Dethiosulfatarculus sandiegensis TaxID=1429043 RepID=A0A0D2J8K1_9BACT|nr:hypothetical protein X474_21155 [Dethiosulfatarculus sandiegensis]